MIVIHEMLIAALSGLAVFCFVAALSVLVRDAVTEVRQQRPR